MLKSNSKSKSKCPWCGQSLNADAHQQLATAENRERERLRHEFADDIRRDEKKKLERQLRKELTTSIRKGLEKKRVAREATELARAERRLKIVEAAASRKAKTLTAREKEIDRLRRQLERVANADRGEMGESDLYEQLRQMFPGDEFSRVRRSGDIVHTVIDARPSGREPVGRVLYEVKNTARWENRFIGKAKKDAHARRARFVVIASRSLPSGVQGLCERDGVLIVNASRAVGLAGVLRQVVIELYRAECGGADLDEKLGLLHEYIRSPEFRRDFDAVGSAIRDMAHVDDKEKASHERTWAQREALQGALQRAHANLTLGIRSIVEGARTRNSVEKNEGRKALAH